MLLASIILFSCKKSSPNNTQNNNQNTGTGTTGSFSFNFNNTFIDGSGSANHCVITDNYLYMGGYAGNVPGSTQPKYSFFFNIKLPSNSITLGTYSTNDNPNNYLDFQSERSVINNTTNYDDFSANQSTTGVMQVTINSYNPSTRIVNCSFSGTVSDDGNVNYNITNGTISANLYLNN
jgi:hypothetical protein